MNRGLVIALSILLSPAVAPAQAGSQPARQNQSKVQREIIELDSQRMRAMVHVDIAALDRILADDLTYTHSTGRVDTKATLLGALRSGELKYEMIEPENIEARVYGDAAVVTGRATMAVRSGNQRSSFQIRFTDVYVKRHGRWQMCAWQSTRLPQP